ncbi:zinc-binding dehydrogenase [Streptomyces sp. NPDC001508]|uniref:zinc-binding dehydrogenase n=1 Tax=Streptomyces sp. NPDC001508 TaxID=3154656 RepID=UPI00332F34D9
MNKPVPSIVARETRSSAEGSTPDARGCFRGPARPRGRPPRREPDRHERHPIPSRGHRRERQDARDRPGRLRPRYHTVQVHSDRAGMQAIADTARSGALRAKVDTTLPLARAAEAHRRGETGRIDKKLVLIP